MIRATYCILTVKVFKENTLQQKLEQIMEYPNSNNDGFLDLYITN